MDEKIVWEFKKNSRELVRVILKKWNGRKLIDLRTYYPVPNSQDGSGAGEFKPGPKGLCLQVEMLPQLKAAVMALEQALAQEES